MYKKIDFRVRPPYGNYLTMFQNEQAHFARLADAFDMTVSESQRTGNLEQFVKEMDLADIELSVVPGRKNLGVPTSIRPTGMRLFTRSTDAGTGGISGE